MQAPGLPPHINLHALQIHTSILASELSWLLKWWIFNHKVTLKNSLAHCSPTEHTHKHVWTSSTPPTAIEHQPSSHQWWLEVVVVFFWVSVCPCVCGVGGGGGAPEGTADQITSSCHHGTTPSTLPPLPLSPKRRHTAVIAQNKMSCQSRKITQ